MDQIYRTEWAESHLHPSLGNSGTVSCAWSCSNLLAFTSEKNVKGFLERFIHIIDPNQPWDVYTIPHKSASVKSLHWNQTGTKLLCSDSNGFCSVWTMSNHLTNVWLKKSSACADLQGEDILTASWLHNGKKVVFHTDKSDNVNEKLMRSSCRPSVTQLGGHPMEGYVAVTGSGRVVVKVLTQDDEITVAKASLNHPVALVLADIAFSAQGNIVIMATDCDLCSPICFWTVSLKYDGDTGKLSSQVDSLPSITLKCNSDPAVKYDSISHIRFVSRESSDHVLVCVDGNSGSMIEGWLIKKEPQVKLHPAFMQMSSSSNERVLRWQFVTSSQPLPKVLSITIPPLPISTSSSATKASIDHKFFCGIGVAAALADNTIQILHRITLAPLMSQQIPDTVGVHETKFGKRVRTAERRLSVQHIEFSATSCALAVFDDSAGLMMYKVAPWLNSKGVAGGQLAVHHLVNLLHFCIFTGFEWWDVLLHMQINIIKSVCEQLSNEYSKLPPPLQQALQSRLLSVKVTIYQTIGNSEATDCHLRLFFEAITVVFRSLLRPPQDSLDEQAPADKLREACSASYETDISKLLQCVDTDANTLQSLQQLIQWVADVTLYLLSIVPQASVSSIPGASLLHDEVWLSTLRELLVIIQTWKLLKSACSPVFCCLDDQMDCLSHLFKLVTEVWHSISTDELQKHIPDSVVDECCLLPNLVMIPCLDVIKPVDGVLQRLNVIPYRFEFGRKPHGNSHPSRFSSLDFIRPSENLGKVDNLRRIFLGTCPIAPVKQCMRCGIISLLNSPQPTLGFWDQRFVRSCLCGGRWRKVDHTVNKK